MRYGGSKARRPVCEHAHVRRPSAQHVQSVMSIHGQMCHRTESGHHLLPHSARGEPVHSAIGRIAHVQMTVRIRRDAHRLPGLCLRRRRWFHVLTQCISALRKDRQARMTGIDHHEIATTRNQCPRIMELTRAGADSTGVGIRTKRQSQSSNLASVPVSRSSSQMSPHSLTVTHDGAPVRQSSPMARRALVLPP